MNATCQLGELRESIEQVTLAVFETMLGVEVRPGAPGNHDACCTGFTAAVCYAGAWSGAVLLDCSLAQAQEWAARFLELEGEATADDARDGLAEVSNIIAGNLKPLFPPGAHLSFPSVVDGREYRFQFLGGEASESYFFEDRNGPFRLRLVMAFRD